MRNWFMVVLATLLLACGSRLSGTYKDSTGMASYTFSSGGKVSVGALGMETEMDYKVEDGKVKIQTPNGPAMVLTMLQDGSIQGPMGIKLIKQK